MSHPDQCERCGDFESVRGVQPGDPGADIYRQLCAECRNEIARREYKREPELNPDR